MTLRTLLLILSVLPILATAEGAAAAPRLGIASLAELPVVERTPYDTNADATAAVDAAFARAKQDGKRVLIDMGGNWCGDCIVLANLMLLPEMILIAIYMNIMAYRLRQPT